MARPGFEIRNSVSSGCSLKMNMKTVPDYSQGNPGSQPRRPQLRAPRSTGDNNTELIQRRKGLENQMDFNPRKGKGLVTLQAIEFNTKHR